MNISIDIGTSHSSVFYLDASGEPQPVNVRTGMSMYGSDYSLPSAIYVDQEGNVLVGQAAMNSRKLDPTRFRAEFKRELGQDVPILLGERSMLPEEMYTEIFRHLKACAEKAANEQVNKAFITHPASFSQSKKQKVQEAAGAAGLYDVVLLDEPTAAAMCYCADGKVKDGQTLLVYDFGGGTFDAALIRCENGKFRPLVDAVGLERCGGIDIDRAIYADMMAAAASVIDETGLRQNRLGMLRFQSALSELALKAKCHLTSAPSFDEGIAVGFDFVPYSLNVERLNGMIAGKIQQTIDCCQQLLKNAGLSISDVDCILLVGGTSRVPLVEQMVRQFAKEVPVLSNVNPELAVAQGALAEVNAAPEKKPEPVPSQEHDEKEKLVKELIGVLKTDPTLEESADESQNHPVALPSILNSDVMKRIASTSSFDFAVTPDGKVMRTTPAAFFAFLDGNLFRSYSSKLYHIAEICCIAGSLAEDVLFRSKTGLLVTQDMASIENKPSDLLQRLLSSHPMSAWEDCVQFLWRPATHSSNSSGTLIGVRKNGTLLFSDPAEFRFSPCAQWKDIKKLAIAKDGQLLALTNHGSLLLDGTWPEVPPSMQNGDLVDIAVSRDKAANGGYSFVAIHADGTVSVCGDCGGRNQQLLQIKNAAGFGFGAGTCIVLKQDGRLEEVFSGSTTLKLEGCIAFYCSDTMNYMAVDRHGNTYTWGCLPKRKNEVSRWPKMI